MVKSTQLKVPIALDNKTSYTNLRTQKRKNTIFAQRVKKRLSSERGK